MSVCKQTKPGSEWLLLEGAEVKSGALQEQNVVFLITPLAQLLLSAGNSKAFSRYITHLVRTTCINEFVLSGTFPEAGPLARPQV